MKIESVSYSYLPPEKAFPVFPERDQPFRVSVHVVDYELLLQALGARPLHATGCGYRLSSDARGGWSCDKCGWPAEPVAAVEHPPDPGDVHTG